MVTKKRTYYKLLENKIRAYLINPNKEMAEKYDCNEFGYIYLDSFENPFLTEREAIDSDYMIKNEMEKNG